MADNKTRRVIEVQSDLYQKENLDRELPEVLDSFVKYKGETYKVKGINNKGELGLGDNNTKTFWVNSSEVKDLPHTLQRKAEVAKLQQYSNPTAHFRMIREEIKKASQDGKTKLQFPTGETAMKIEGLGINNQETGWYHNIGSRRTILDRVGLEPKNADDFIGLEIYRNGDSNSWIITDVLGDGSLRLCQKHGLQMNLLAIVA